MAATYIYKCHRVLYRDDAGNRVFEDEPEPLKCIMCLNVIDSGEYCPICLAEINELKNKENGHKH